MDDLKSLVVELPNDVKNAVAYGDFERATELIEIYMTRNIPTILKERLQYERDRIRRLKENYIYTFEEAYQMATSKIKDFTRKELKTMMDERYADWIYINGEVMLISSFLNNIVKVNNDIKERLYEKSVKSKDSECLVKTVNEMLNGEEKKYFIHLKTGIKLNSNARVGETVKVHLPIPRNAQQIKNIKIINTSHEPKVIAPVDYPQRTIYFEEKVTGEDVFTVEYSYENHVKYTNLDPELVSDKQPTFYTEEWPPHIRFTPFLCELAKEIVGTETNPLLKARKIYDYITKNVQYSFMPQYAVLTNVPEYCAYNLKGDCGVQALLFITLCRIVGIPSRWQSGLYANPYFVGCHDWAEFYIEPYGWVFADVSFGGGAVRSGDTNRWNFYFGNLEPFRMVANSETNYEFSPAKDHLRYDPCDNQSGEIEYSDRFLYSNEYETFMDIVDIHEI